MTVHSAARNRIDPLLTGLASADPEAAGAAKEALVADPPRAVPLLVACLDADDDRLRLRSISLLGLLGDERAGRPLASLLHDPSPLVRQRAAGALARVSSPDTVATLARLLAREPEARVRHVAVRSLARLAQTGHENASRPLLERLADDAEDPRVRIAALEAVPWLVGRGGAAPVRALLERLATDASGAVAQRARRILSSQSRPRLEAWAIQRLLEDLGCPRLGSWRRAIAQLGRAGGGIVEPAVLALLARPTDREYARRVVFLLKELSPRQLTRIGGYLDLVREPVPLETLVEIASHAGGRSIVVRLAALVRSLADDEAAGPGPLHGARARAHLALAQAGSRIAADDLRVLLEDRRFPVRPELVQAAAIVGTRRELGSLLRAYRRARGMTRLALREAVLAVLRREKIRRTDRSLLALEAADRKAALEILGLPRPARPRPVLASPRVDRPSTALLT
ncbi:MAG: HEAT repeat domain-containing protein [Acidobacteria bacterium]|jgi:HEAT repeat protein|nr:HEAT repeat domain-containing protein [Acidobacteriota bacterium]